MFPQVHLFTCDNSSILGRDQRVYLSACSEMDAATFNAHLEWSGAAPEEAPQPEDVEAPLEETVRAEREYLRRRLREELKREPTEEEVDEWLRRHTEGY